MGADAQKKVRLYFLDGGFWAGMLGMKDADYDQMVLAKVNSLNLRQRALAKTGLDEDQLKEIAPVYIHGFNFDNNEAVKVGADGRLRSSQYDAAWLFFSDTHVYAFRVSLDMGSESSKEKTEEYFYKDITSFSTVEETVDVTPAAGCLGGAGKKQTRKYTRFALAVPGDGKFYCSTTGAPDAERSVSAMKQKLREKKQS